MLIQEKGTIELSPIIMKNEEMELDHDMAPLGAMVCRNHVRESTLPLNVLYNEGMETLRVKQRNCTPPSEDKITPIEFHLCEDDARQINNVECKKIQYEEEEGVKKIDFKIRLEPKNNKLVYNSEAEKTIQNLKREDEINI